MGANIFADIRTIGQMEDDRPIWENPSPRWKGSSTKKRRTKKQIAKDRKKKKMNKRNRH